MSDHRPWVYKYAPKNSNEIIGQNKAIQKIIAYVTTYKQGKKPLLLTGPPGIGKTSCVYAVAQELDREIIEVNASDTRSKDAITSLVGAASKQQSLFFRSRIILIDEIDGVSGMSDRGAIPA